MKLISTLHISGPMGESLGGPPQALEGTLNALISSYFKTKILVIESRVSKEQEEVKFAASPLKIVETLQVHPKASRYQFSLRLPIKILTDASEVDAIVIHGFYTFSLFCAIKLKRFHGKPILVMPHGSLEPYQGKHHKFRKYLFRKILGNLMLIDGIMTATNSETTAVLDNRWIRERNIHVVEVGVSIQSDFNLKSNLHFQFPNFDNYILFIGRIVHKKRIDICIDAMKILSKTNLDLKLKIAGDGDQELIKKLKEKVNFLNLSQNIEFVGHVTGDAKWRLISEARATLLPSENENFAISVAESLLVGTPPIVSKWVALSTVVEEFAAGEILQNLNPQELAESVNKILTNHKYYSVNAKSAALVFSPKIVGERWYEILNNILISVPQSNR